MSTNEQYQLSLSAEEIDKRLSNSVLATEQELTFEKQIQARKNIGSMLLGVGTPAVRAPIGTLYMDTQDGSLYKRVVNDEYDVASAGWSSIFMDKCNGWPVEIHATLSETESGIVSTINNSSVDFDYLSHCVSNYCFDIKALVHLNLGDPESPQHLLMNLTSYDVHLDSVGKYYGSAEFGAIALGGLSFSLCVQPHDTQLSVFLPANF